MYSNQRTTKEPEINPFKTSSMATWNTGTSTSNQNLLPQNIQTEFRPVDRYQALNDATKRYHERTLTVYCDYVRDLSALGFTLMPMGNPVDRILEVLPTELVNEQPPKTFRSNQTYGEYKRKGMDDNFSAVDDWSDNNKRQKVQNGHVKRDPRPNHSSANRMPTGWSDDESVSGRSNTEERRGGFRGGGRGMRRGGRFRGGGRSPRYVESQTSFKAVSSGWSDDENDSSQAQNQEDKANPISDNTKSMPDDESWDDIPAEKEKISRKPSNDESWEQPIVPPKDDECWD